MALSVGKRLGPYEIVSPLGSGGMGEVYRARDVRLNRIVAIKVLSGEVASDSDRLRRFGQEARAASALNHPSILTVLDVGTEGSLSYIAMELVEGKTLQSLLSEGPLHAKRLLEIAVQIADGLASAHDAGIVHRDLKPANVMVSKEGFVKIVDFGLAKGAPPPSYVSSVDTDAQTEDVSQTEPGILVGTVSYMSPEQVSGKRVDFRSDQFSFGAVLYEMATARRAFRGSSRIDTLSAILHDNPEPMSGPGVRIPTPLRWIIDRCLAKEPEHRFASTTDLARDLTSLRDHLGELSDSGSGGWSGPKAPRHGLGVFQRRVLPFAALGAILAAALWAIARTRAAGERVTLSLLPPPESSFNFNTTTPAPASLSPDGERLVFGAREASGKSMLWVRGLEDSTARPLAGTEGALYPFWSPDSTAIAFFAGGRLKRIPASGGIAEILCEAHDGRGGTWARDGRILIAPDSTGPIVELSAKGGAPRAVTREDTPPGDYSHRWPSFLPDQRHFLFLRHNPSRREDGIYVASVDSKESRRILPDSSNAVYSPPGYLVFARSGALVAARFDVGSLALAGEPLLLSEHVNYHAYRWNAAFTVSANGRLAYEPGPPPRAGLLTWYDRSGRELGTVGAPADYGGIRLSPDGTRCAVEVQDAATGMMGIWVIELSRGVATRLSSAGSMNVSPTWSPDGSRIVFTSSRGGHWNLVERDSAAAGTEELLNTSRDNQAPTDWSPDGKRIAFNNSGPDPGDKYQLWMFDVAERRPAAHLRSPFNERDGVFSPDGSLLAYVSDESGRPEVCVRPVGSSSQKWQISSEGGAQPSWRRDGGELWYLGPNNVLFAVSVKESAGLPPQFGAPVRLFEAPLRASASDLGLYAGTASGQTFLVVTSGKEAVSTLNVVLNWTRFPGR